LGQIEQGGGSGVSPESRKTGIYVPPVIDSAGGSLVDACCFKFVLFVNQGFTNFVCPYRENANNRKNG
jgi:hypothetical protein